MFHHARKSINRRGVYDAGPNRIRRGKPVNSNSCRSLVANVSYRTAHSKSYNPTRPFTRTIMEQKKIVKKNTIRSSTLLHETRQRHVRSAIASWCRTTRLARGPAASRRSTTSCPPVRRTCRRSTWTRDRRRCDAHRRVGGFQRFRRPATPRDVTEISTTVQKHQKVITTAKRIADRVHPDFSIYPSSRSSRRVRFRR